MRHDQFARLLEFVARLERERLSYQLQVVRPDAVCVAVTVPGQRWEVEFMADGSVEVERFMSDGDMGDEAHIEALFRDFD